MVKLPSIFGLVFLKGSEIFSSFLIASTLPNQHSFPSDTIDSISWKDRLASVLSDLVHNTWLYFKVVERTVRRTGYLHKSPSTARRLVFLCTDRSSLHAL